MEFKKISEADIKELKNLFDENLKWSYPEKLVEHGWVAEDSHGLKSVLLCSDSNYSIPTFGLDVVDGREKFSSEELDFYSSKIKGCLNEEQFFFKLGVDDFNDEYQLNKLEGLEDYFHYCGQDVFSIEEPIGFEFRVTDGSGSEQVVSKFRRLAPRGAEVTYTETASSSSNAFTVMKADANDREFVSRPWDSKPDSEWVEKVERFLVDKTDFNYKGFSRMLEGSLVYKTREAGRKSGSQRIDRPDKDL